MAAFWSEEQTATCRKMWAEGASATDIAMELDCGLTRNAVIGKIHRLGITRRPRTAKRPRKRGTGSRTHNLTRLQAKARGDDPGLPPDAPALHHAGGLKTLIELQPHDCRYVINTPGSGEVHLFCALPRMNGEPYCAEHCRVAFRVGPYVPWQRRTTQ